MKKVFICLVILGIVVVHGQSVNITGTVTARDCRPLEGVDIALAQYGISTVTDANGFYELSQTSITDNLSEGGAYALLQFRGQKLFFSVNKKNQLLRIDIFSINGKHLKTVINSKLGVGSYSFPLITKTASAQMYVVSIQIDDLCTKYKYLYVPGRMNGNRELVNQKELKEKTVTAIGVVRQGGLPDTILVTKSGFIKIERVIQSYAGEYNFILDTNCATVRVRVREDSTNIPINSADVVIYNSNSNQGVTRAFTDTTGTCYLYVQPNDAYYIRVAAQGYSSSPPRNGAAIPFEVEGSGSVTSYGTLLNKSPLTNCGTISGLIQSTVSEPVPGCLVIAIRHTDSITVSGFSGPDGFYILYNVPEGTYEVLSYQSGWYQADPVVGVSVVRDVVTPNIDVEMTANSGTPLSGRITFLASQNAIVDITLAHPVSFEAIPGLDTMMHDGSSTYDLNAIPPGIFIPWASYRNDGYVMDPDWIRKFGLPVLTFALGDSAKELDFSITDAITIISPTNHPDTLVPVEIASQNPTFSWESYPSTQEYVIAVYNSFGMLIWGGYDENNNVLHAKINSQTTSVMFNFDSSATEPIRWGSYRWKVWADKNGTDGVQQLISSSEDLMGLFCLPGR